MNRKTIVACTSLCLSLLYRIFANRYTIVFFFVGLFDFVSPTLSEVGNSYEAFLWAETMTPARIATMAESALWECAIVLGLFTIVLMVGSLIIMCLELWRQSRVIPMAKRFLRGLLEELEKREESKTIVVRVAFKGSAVTLDKSTLSDYPAGWKIPESIITYHLWVVQLPYEKERKQMQVDKRTYDLITDCEDTQYCLKKKEKGKQYEFVSANSVKDEEVKDEEVKDSLEDDLVCAECMKSRTSEVPHSVDPPLSEEKEMRQRRIRTWRLPSPIGKREHGI